MTELAQILINHSLDSQESKDYFQQTFEAIKGKETGSDERGYS